MNNLKIPTSRDIYIEVDGKKLATVQSYSVKSSKESTPIEAFGSDLPVATIPGRQSHIIELVKIIPSPQATSQNVDFFSLTNFNLMIVKPDCRIIYSSCNWQDISESSSLNNPCFEKITLSSARRLVLC